MTTAIAATVAFPKFAIRIASTRIAKFAIAFVLAASLMLNGYFYVAASTINNDLVAAGIVQAPTSTSLVDRLEMSILGNNVASVAISAGQAAAAAQQLQAALVEAQAALAASAQ